MCSLFCTVIVTGQDIDVSKLPAPAARRVDFVKDIQPVLERSCLKCHNATVSMSGLRLDNREEALKGGDLGVDIVPGHSAESRAIHFAGRLVPQLEMPPKGKGDPLSDEEIGLLRAWIDQGAEWQAGVVLQSRPKPAPGSETDKAGVKDSSTLPPPANRKVDFVKEIRPLLASKCYPCHGPSQQKNQLRWDVKAVATRGGISGPAFKPGKSAESLVIRLVGGLQPGLVMPLQGERLTSTEIGLLRAWIDQGAHWPEGLDPKGYTAPLIHWAYRPLARPSAPRVKGSSFVVLPDSRGLPYNGQGSFSSGFLPAAHQGTLVRATAPVPINDLFAPRSAAYITKASEEEGLALLGDLNREHLAHWQGDSRLEARITAYELAARMQLSIPGVFDISRESEATRKLYGLDEKDTEDFGRSCLIARRLLEQGVRFVQVWSGTNWDNHSNITNELGFIAKRTDMGVAGLFKDLKARGLLEDTLVIWTTEFGRMPFSQGSSGRDHNGGTFVTWLGGAGIKGGVAHGQSDEWAWKAVENSTASYDLHATILHLLGIDHKKLTYRHNGIDRRLTDVHGHAIREILA